MRKTAFYLAAALVVALATGSAAASDAPHDRPNIVIFTLDDMDRDSVGVYGNPLPGITPHIDALAERGLRFDRAFVPTAVCQPSRQSLMTAQHPHRNGTFGFVPLKADAYTLGKMLNEAGYYTASFGKGRDYSPVEAHGWDDFVYWAKQWNRSPDDFAALAEQAIEAAEARDEPFFLNVNCSDPHRPFAGSLQEQQRLDGMKKWLPKWIEDHRHELGDADPQPEDYFIVEPGQNLYETQAPPIPGYLPSGVTRVEREVGEYFASVHRGDQTLGSIIDLLKDRGLDDNTVIIFFSDHGASLPSSKNDTFPQSVQVPMIVVWPGITEPGGIDDKHFVSTMDLFPTLAKALGQPVRSDWDGRSLWPLLHGQTQEKRSSIFTGYNYYKPGKQVFPTRAITTADYHYMFQPWVDVHDAKPNVESHQGRSFRAIRDAAETDPATAAWLDRYLHRHRDALYDLVLDPFCQTNVANEPEYAEALKTMKRIMSAAMQRSEDPMMKVFLSEQSVEDAFPFDAPPQTPTTE